MLLHCCVQLGLRTLCIARRHLNSEEFDHLNQLLKNARTAMDDRDAKVGCVVSNIIDKITMLAFKMRSPTYQINSCNVCDVVASCIRGSGSRSGIAWCHGCGG